jgi:hypothetical protein
MALNTTPGIYLAVSLTCVYVLFFVITPWVFTDLNEYKLQNFTKTFSKQLSIELIKGSCSHGNRAVINTSKKSKTDYVDVPHSMNKLSGIEFSYSFWMKLHDPTPQILFMKGIYQDDTSNPGLSDAKIYNKDTLESTEHTKINDDINGTNHEQLVKCPLIRFDPTKQLIISFNSKRKIHNQISFDYEDILNSSQNNPRWFLFSMVFREGPFTTEYGLNTQGIVVDLYVNEQHVKSKFIENDSLKLNEGNIHIFPEAKESTDNTFGDLNYHNFALSVTDVEKIWKKGFTRGGCSVSGTTTINPQLNDLGKHAASLF